MGLIKAAVGAIGSTVHDQWKENKFQNHKYLAYFYMQDSPCGQYFLIVILNSMMIS